MKKLSLIGMGIVNERSIPLLGLDRLKEANLIFAELFTSILEEGSLERLSQLAGKEIRLLDREDVEETEMVLGAFENADRICFLTAGDPLSATTHQEMRLDAEKRGVEVEIINAASIFTAAPGISGLQQYKFGRTTALAFPEEGFFPTSPLDVIESNLERGLHSLVLLDIQAHRDRYMSAPEGAALLLRMVEKKGGSPIGPETMMVAVARAGHHDRKLVYSSLGKLSNMSLGPPPHCLIIPGKLHFLEEEVLDSFRVE